MKGLYGEFVSAPQPVKTLTLGASVFLVGFMGASVSWLLTDYHLPSHVKEYQKTKQELTVKQFSLEDSVSLPGLSERKSQLENRLQKLSEISEVREYVSSPMQYTLNTLGGYIVIGSLGVMLLGAGLTVKGNRDMSSKPEYQPQ